MYTFDKLFDTGLKASWLQQINWKIFLYLLLAVVNAVYELRSTTD